MIDINNNLIAMNRGDTFEIPLIINLGTKVNPQYYHLTEHDTVYFALLEHNQRFEEALVRKVFTVEDLNAEGDVVIKLSCEDTERLLPGNYLYEIKLRHAEGDIDFVDTIVPRRKFVILE